jgi:hypothetical protein
MLEYNGRLEKAAQTVAKKYAKKARKEAKKEGYTKEGLYKLYKYYADISDLLLDFEDEANTEVDTKDDEEEVAEMIFDALHDQDRVCTVHKKKDEFCIVIEKR